MPPLRVMSSILAPLLALKVPFTTVIFDAVALDWMWTVPLSSVVLAALLVA